MSFNIIDMVKEQLTDQVVGHLGSVIGGDADQSSSAISAAIPGLLSSLTSAGATKEGAAGLFDAISKQDDGILDNLGDMLSGDKQSSLIESGTSMLGSVLGDNALGGLTNALSGFSGASKGGITSMLGMFAPMIFGMLKRKLMGGSDGFNVGSLMNLLNGQKENIAAAMPSGFADKLNFVGVEDTVQDTVKDVKNVAREASHTAHETVEEGGSLLGKLLPLALLAGAAYFAYNYFTGVKTVAPEAPATTEIVEKVTTEVSKGDLIDIEGLSSNVTKSLGSLTSGLESIKDADSAKAVLPDLTAAADDMGKYAGMLDKLPDAAKGPIIAMVGEALPKIQGILDTLVRFRALVQSLSQ